MKAALLACLFFACVLALVEAFPSPSEFRTNGKEEVKLSRKKVKRQEEDFPFDVNDIGSWSIITRMHLSEELLDSDEMNETDCLHCCGTNTTALPQLPGTMDKGQVVPSNHNKRVIPLVKANITDPLGAGNNRTNDRCFGCCFNATVNATTENSEARQRTALPPTRSLKRT